VTKLSAVCYVAMSDSGVFSSTLMFDNSAFESLLFVVIASDQYSTYFQWSA